MVQVQVSAQASCARRGYGARADDPVSVSHVGRVDQQQDKDVFAVESPALSAAWLGRAAT
jgi:hypothetical protein